LDAGEACSDMLSFLGSPGAHIWHSLMTREDSVSPGRGGGCRFWCTGVCRCAQVAHRLAGHLQEGEEQQQDDGKEMQQLRDRVHRLRRPLRLPRLPPRPRWHAAEMRPEHRPPASVHIRHVSEVAITFLSHVCSRLCWRTLLP
jgi:hypothetical protein